MSLIEAIAKLAEGRQRWGGSVETQVETVTNKAGALEAIIPTVAGSAQEAMEHLAELQHKSQAGWSEWSLVDSEEYQGPKARVEALETGHPSVPEFGAETHSDELLRNIAERVADVESEGPRGFPGSGVGLQPKKISKSVVESKVVANLADLTDDKSEFRQWDLKMVNALAQVRKSYGKAIEDIKEFIDTGKDPEDARMGVTGERLSPT